MTEDFDLFGNPYIAKPTKRGRPPHEVTKKTRSRVSMLVALGWTNPRIAAVLDITLPTLHKYYFYELRQRDVGRQPALRTGEERAGQLDRKACRLAHYRRCRKLRRAFQRSSAPHPYL